MPPSKLYIKVKSLERLIKEETNYKEKLKHQQQNYEVLSNSKNADQNELKVAKDLVEETNKVLIPQLFSKLEQFENDLNEYLVKHGIEIRDEVNNYKNNSAASNKNNTDLSSVISVPLEPHRRNVKLNNDMTSNNEPLDLDEFEYMKERIIYLFLTCADIKRKRYEDFNAKSISPKLATLEDAVNDDEIY
ncbi:hypothetical protein ACO0SA_000115 [Hanseniaspora valbyensis]